MQYRYRQGWLGSGRCAREDSGNGPQGAPAPDAVPKAHHMGSRGTSCLGPTGPGVASAPCTWGILARGPDALRTALCCYWSWGGTLQGHWCRAVLHRCAFACLRTTQRVYHSRTHSLPSCVTLCFTGAQAAAAWPTRGVGLVQSNHQSVLGKH